MIKWKKCHFLRQSERQEKTGVFFQLIVCYTKVVHLHGFFLFHKMQSSVDIFIFQMVFFIYIVDYNERDENKIGHLFFYIQYFIISMFITSMAGQSKNFDLFQINFLYGNKLLRYISNIKNPNNPKIPENIKNPINIDF